MKNRWIASMAAAALSLTLLAGCVPTDGPAGKTDNPDNPPKGGKYEGAFSETDGTYGGVDALGRKLSLDGQAPAPKSDKKVGIFYFLWQGQHGTGGPYDNYKIATENPKALKSEAAWIKAGGGNVGEHSFWGEPMFGYYTSNDTWVMRKHLQMLMAAGVDFLVFDTTNAYTYSAQTKKLIEVWYEYLEKGYDVPKLSFYTNSNSGNTINSLYKELHGNKKLNEKYPRLSELWFCYEGKPMVVGNPNDPALDDVCKDYFRIKQSVWPNSGRHDDGFPWMEFGRLLSDDAVYGLNGKKEVVNVSIAQHSDTCMMSATAWYGANDRTRSWHNGANDTSENAVLYGYNFAEQWEWAIGVDPDMVFVTGWNEWVAQRQPTQAKYPIVFVDCCDPNTSRDSEPMNGLFGDNYYLQLCDYVRKYKGTPARVNVGGDVTVDVNGSFDQWDSNAITAKYTDYSNDTVKRNSKGFGNISYKDDTGRNDFVSLKAAKDSENLYFYAETAEDITSSDDSAWMTLFLSSGVEGNAKWEGLFDFAVNLEKPEGNTVKISKYAADGTWSVAGTGTMKAEGNRLMLSVSREVLGIGGNPVNVQFKWADNYQRDENGQLDVFSFYKNGDAAPIGRFTYVFSEMNY